MVLLDLIEQRTGVKLEVLSNSEQRFLGYKAIAMKETEFQKIIQKGTAIADVSFGSLQISLFDKDSLVSTQNIQQGILRLRETLAGVWSDRQTVRGIFEDMVDNELYAFKKMYLKLFNAVTDALEEKDRDKSNEILKKAQCDCEEIYIEEE